MYVYIQVRKPTSGCSNYDESKVGLQVTLIYSNKVCIARSFGRMDEKTADLADKQLFVSNFKLIVNLIVID